MSKEDKKKDGKLLYCSFCGKSQHEVLKLIAGPSVFICDQCVDLCNDIITEEMQELLDTEEKTMNTIKWSDFEKVELRVGTVLAVDEFPEARKPAYKLTIDFGEEIGQRKSSAQITTLYKPEDLIGTQIMAVVNFPPKQIGPFMSQCLVTGYEREDGAIVLARPTTTVPNGSKLM